MKIQFLRLHWFFVIAPVILAINLLVGLTARGQVDRLVEAGLLFDLAVLLPCLYWLCYRAQGKRAVARAAALACLGIWIALKVVPEPERDLMNYVAPLRYVGLAALFWLECVVIFAIYKSIFSGSTSQETVTKAADQMPSWVARLMTFEAGLWLRAWTGVKRLFGIR